VAGAASDLRFDLVVATVDRVEPLDALLATLDEQTHRAFRLVVVDQNADDRLATVLARHPDLDVLRLRSERGLSRARNVALPMLTADLVAFPDDDCAYRPDLLERVATRFAADAGVDGLTGRAAAGDGASHPSWEKEPAVLTPRNLWNRVISFTLFLRRELVERVGSFDERLGLGSGTTWSSGEEVEYVVRALRMGARIEYDPALVVTHPVRSYSPTELRAIGRRDGASIGWILRRHGYGQRTTARMLLRPLGGVGTALARGDLTRAAFHAATLEGRVRGYLGAPTS
jgi:GT2 family glycosyltransferase